MGFIELRKRQMIKSLNRESKSKGIIITAGTGEPTIRFFIFKLHFINGISHSFQPIFALYFHFSHADQIAIELFGDIDLMVKIVLFVFKLKSFRKFTKTRRNRLEINKLPSFASQKKLRIQYDFLYYEIVRHNWLLHDVFQLKLVEHGVIVLDVQEKSAIEGQLFYSMRQDELNFLLELLIWAKNYLLLIIYSISLFIILTSLLSKNSRIEDGSMSKIRQTRWPMV